MQHLLDPLVLTQQDPLPPSPSTMCLSCHGSCVSTAELVSSVWILPALGFWHPLLLTLPSLLPSSSSAPGSRPA